RTCRGRKSCRSQLRLRQTLRLHSSFCCCVARLLDSSDPPWPSSVILTRFSSSIHRPLIVAECVLAINCRPSSAAQWLNAGFSLKKRATPHGVAHLLSLALTGVRVREAQNL